MLVGGNDGVGVGDGEVGSLSRGIGNWSVGLAGSSPSAGGWTCGAAVVSLLRTARLITKPAATTTSTPARMTAAGMRNSLRRRCPVPRSSGGTAAPRRPVLR